MLVNGLNDNEGWVSPKIPRLSDRKSWFMFTEISLRDQVNSNSDPCFKSKPISNVVAHRFFLFLFQVLSIKSPYVQLKDTNIDIKRPSRHRWR